jgi:hypothetical protein
MHVCRVWFLRVPYLLLGGIFFPTFFFSAFCDHRENGSCVFRDVPVSPGPGTGSIFLPTAKKKNQKKIKNQKSSTYTNLHSCTTHAMPCFYTGFFNTNAQTFTRCRCICTRIHVRACILRYINAILPPLRIKPSFSFSVCILCGATQLTNHFLLLLPINSINESRPENGREKKGGRGGVEESESGLRLSRAELNRTDQVPT